MDLKAELVLPQPNNIDGEDLKRYAIWLSEFEAKNGRLPTGEEVVNWQAKSTS